CTYTAAKEKRPTRGRSFLGWGGRDRSRPATPELHGCEASSHRKIPLRTATGSPHLRIRLAGSTHTLLPKKNDPQGVVLSLAGVAGIEPANHGTKTRCLTAWLHPNTMKLYAITDYTTPQSVTR